MWLLGLHNSRDRLRCHEAKVAQLWAIHYNAYKFLDTPTQDRRIASQKIQPIWKVLEAVQ
jgi:hypothetical protein